MKHFITSSEAAVLLEVLRKIKRANNRSKVMMAAIDIDTHDIEKVGQIIKKLSL